MEANEVYRVHFDAIIFYVKGFQNLFHNGIASSIVYIGALTLLIAP